MTAGSVRTAVPAAGTDPAGRDGLGLAVLPAATEPVLARVAERAGEVDRAEADLWDELAALGRLDLLAAPLPLAAELTHALARRCTASAFALWGHRSAIAYHEATGTPLPDGAASGVVALASGMAPAFKEEAGLGEIPLLATDSPDGAIAVSGVLPWCSNLRPGGWVVTPVRWEDGRRAVVRHRRDADGVRVKELTGLTALDATASGVLLLDEVRIPAQDVLTRDMPAFRDDVRATFLQIQTAMCLGLAGAALDAAEAGADDVSREVLAEELSAAAEDWRHLREALAAGVRAASAVHAGGAGGPCDDASSGTSPSGASASAAGAAPSASVQPAELVRVRLEAALLTGRATRLEQKIVGGRGYALASDTSRRAREAAFLPVQSPTETHLRHLLARAGVPVPTDGRA
ncbi:acyl-CoA dehydrogenase [Brachybacterium paraconglomeratum]|uniref:acyl-CoA dehydrogenase n=1 Tax=Brachybacterium paraconglomeratum TaxID=173362 RepID=UPI0021A3D4AD|nr:acyl-CoA dehydrogenase [Brachybacterium paraconglomeratum]MCT1908220.1 acyl-CoA dehydrogenase [Brachybacterium paraconglomeratum]